MANEEKGSTKAEIMKSQANYKGKEHSDLVKVTIIKDGDFYKKGDTDIIHPATAEILKAKGLIDKMEKYEAPKEEKEVQVPL